MLCHATTITNHGLAHQSSEGKPGLLPNQLTHVHLHLRLSLLWFLLGGDCAERFHTTRLVTDSASHSYLADNNLLLDCWRSNAQAHHCCNDVWSEPDLPEHEKYHGQNDMERNTRNYQRGSLLHHIQCVQNCMVPNDNSITLEARVTLRLLKSHPIPQNGI